VLTGAAWATKVERRSVKGGETRMGDGGFGEAVIHEERVRFAGGACSVLVEARLLEDINPEWERGRPAERGRQREARWSAACPTAGRHAELSLSPIKQSFEP
jgi:hypothetical protein